MGFVRTLLGDGVDATARKSALANVVGSHHYLNFLNGIHRDRIGTCLSTIRATGRKTEHVVGHRTVNLETVVTVVGAYESDTAVFGSHSQRTVLHDVVDVTVYSRSIFNRVGREVGSSTALCFGIGYDNHFIQQFRTGMQFYVLCISVTQFQHDTGEYCALITYIRHRKLVRATRTHTLDRITSIHIGDSTVLCTGRLMNGNNRRSDYRFTLFVGHLTADSGSRNLRIYAHSRQNQHKRKNKS